MGVCCHWKLNSCASCPKYQDLGRGHIPALGWGIPEMARGPGRHQCPLDSLKHRAMGTSRRAVIPLPPTLGEKGEKLKSNHAVCGD